MSEITFEQFDGSEVLFLFADIRSQGGLKKEIISLVLSAPSPDRACELTDFLMCLQGILDKHNVTLLSGELPHRIVKILNLDGGIGNDDAHSLTEKILQELNKQED